MHEGFKPATVSLTVRFKRARFRLLPSGFSTPRYYPWARGAAGMKRVPYLRPSRAAACSSISGSDPTVTSLSLRLPNSLSLSLFSLRAPSRSTDWTIHHRELALPDAPTRGPRADAPGLDTRTRPRASRASLRTKPSQHAAPRRWIGACRGEGSGFSCNWFPRRQKTPPESRPRNVRERKMRFVTGARGWSKP